MGSLFSSPKPPMPPPPELYEEFVGNDASVKRIDEDNYEE